MRFCHLLRSLVLCLALSCVLANAADSVAVAHVIYDGNGLYYADNESNLKFKSLTMGSDGMFTINFTEERLKASAINDRHLRFGLQCAEGKKDCETFLNPEEANQPTLKELFPDYEEGAEDQPVYEIWIVINDDGTLSTYNSRESIPSDVYIPVPVEKTIRILPPWSNTTAIMNVNGNSNKMVPAPSPYCGWFEVTINVLPKDTYVSFDQTIGDTHIGANGIVKGMEVPIEEEILLDSILAVADTVWIMAKYGFPDISSTYPEELGDCPTKILPVMMFDWLHGAGSDEENTAAQVGTTSQDFGTGGCAQLTKGMVDSTLGENGVPVRASNFPENCKTTEHLDYWFLPEVVATGPDGKKYTNVTCRNLELNLDKDGFWLGQKNKESPEKGLFFLDDFKYLDSAGTIPNPYFDWIKGNDLGTHNYGFTMKIQAQFEYVKGQYFEFYGDDDVWVFINNKLVVDIGGQHHQSNGSVNLDKLGLTVGETYPFHIFYAERHRDESNFKMRTSIDLKADASMFLSNLSDSEEKIQKEVWQIVRERELACDFSSSPEKTKTERGPSKFTLFGKGVSRSGVILKQDTVYFGGISVGNDYTMVTVDLKALGKAMLLPPGNYYIRVSLQSNPDEYKDIYFTVDPYELPNLAYASVKDSNYITFENNDDGTTDTIHHTQYWTPYGDEISRNISSDTLPINLDKNEKLWAGRSYPVNIMYAEEWATIYSGISVKITTSTPSLIACDSMGNVIDEVLLQGGHANFFVRGLEEVVNGTLTISSAGAKNVSVDWSGINMKEPPVPQIETAFIYDRNGDGRGDSIWIHFNKPLGGQSVLDSVKFIFGTSFDEAYKASYKDGDSVATIVAAGTGFGTAIYTGGSARAYSGKINIWYTYTDEEDGKTSIFPVDGALGDKIGPVIIAAEVEYMSDGNTQLKVTFSEGLEGTGANSDMFRFHCWKNGIQDSIVKSASDIGTTPPDQWKLIFPKGSEQDIVPIVGDSIRLTPPSMQGEALDLASVSPHEDNPWVRITGEQRVTVTSPGIITLDKDSETFDSAKVIIQSPEATVPKLVVSEQTLTAEQVAAIYGTQGHYLGDLDMAQLVENEIAEIVKAVQSTPSYVDKKAKDSTTTYTIEEVINMVSRGDMSIKDAKERFGISDVIVDAYKNGLLTKENVHNYQSGTEQDVKQIVDAVADNTELRYKATYYTSLGHFVNSQGGVITCNDDIFKSGSSSNCLDNNGRFFLAWNMRAENGRLASTGVYIARLEIRIKVNSKVITDRTQDFLWGVRRGKVNAIDLGL